MTRTLPNGAYTTVTYNEVGTPTSWINKNSGGTKLSEWGSFAYDGVFNLTETTASNHIASSQFDGYVNFDYTAKDQLAEEDSSRFNGYTESNVWDGASNPTTFRSNSGRTYNGSNQRSNTGYAYDGNGNPTTYAGTACTYDVENRLTAFGSEEYSYRADGLRASVGTGTSKVYYLYDGGNAVCQLDYQGNLLRTYVYAPDGMVGRTGSSQTRYYLFDWQGNVEHSMSSSTNLNVSYAFNAWGQRNQKFPVNADVGANDQFGYNARWGYMRENTTGFYYCQNRYYDPANGRWLTRDPIGFAGGMNVYGYCGGGPVGWADPEGLRKLTRSEESFLYSSLIMLFENGEMGRAIALEGHLRRGRITAGQIGDNAAVTNLVNDITLGENKLNQWMNRQDVDRKNPKNRRLQLANARTAVLECAGTLLHESVHAFEQPWWMLFTGEHGAYAVERGFYQRMRYRRGNPLWLDRSLDDLLEEIQGK